MNLLVIGSGGREHAIVMKLLENKRIDKIYCAPGNGGISKYAECINIKATNINEIIEFVKKKNIEFVVVTPDDPLVLGMVDALEKIKVKTFGPSKAAAIIEGSKIFAKNLMRKYNIPTANYKSFSLFEDAIIFLKKINFPVVIKADGLALGKGVIIANDYGEAYTAIKLIMKDKIFGDSGRSILIEEFLIGVEVSVLCFTDGKTIIPMISSMDHKKIFNNDEGLNTGGMGAVSPNPFYTDDIALDCMNKIFVPTINAMRKENRKFKGCLYFGLMLTKDGPKVIEYNCRFGDPETQVTLPLLKTDLFNIMNAIYEEKLNEINIEWSNKTAVCVVLASEGYPQKYEVGKIINGLNDNGQINESYIYHAGTKIENNNFISSGGRVLGITSVGNNLEETILKTYKLLSQINFDNMYYRKDIGSKALSLIRDNNNGC